MSAPVNVGPVRAGLDNLLAALAGDSSGRVAEETAVRLRSGARCGLISNPSSVDLDLKNTLSALTAAGVQVAALFAPEHGATGASAAGETIQSGTHSLSRIPVHSLYGSTVRPTAEMLSGLDLLIYDLQDVGVRFYTYTWTLSYLVEACAEAGIPLIVLDRPNPLGGEIVEGPVLQSGLESFVGRYAIGARHGMTSGELARYFGGEIHPEADVRVVEMLGWKRSMWWSETRRPWAAPSPNIPTPETAIIYAATCLLEGTNVSEGRGTPLPFKSFGAPWIVPEELVEQLRGRTEARWRTIHFTPCSSKHQGHDCGGVEWYPPAAASWKPSYRALRLGLEIVSALRSVKGFEWRVGASGRSHFDLLIGRQDVRGRLDRGEEPESIAAGWGSDTIEFLCRRARYLLYS